MSRRMRKFPQSHVEGATEAPAGAPDDEPMPDGKDLGQRLSGRHKVSGTTEDLLKHAQPFPLAPAPAAAGCADPKIDSHFCDDVSYKGLRDPRKLRA